MKEKAADRQYRLLSQLWYFDGRCNGVLPSDLIHYQATERLDCYFGEDGRVQNFQVRGQVSFKCDLFRPLSSLDLADNQTSSPMMPTMSSSGG